MGIFFKKLTKKTEAIQEKSPTTEGFGLFFRKTLLSCANGLEKLTAKFTRLHWLIALSLFIVFAGGLNVFLITNGLLKNGKSTFSVTAISKSKYLTQTGEELSNNDAWVSEKEYLRINSFLFYMDSLKNSPTGQTVYDSILLNRPGLMDSARFLQRKFHTKLIEKFSNKIK